MINLNSTAICPLKYVLFQKKTIIQEMKKFALEVQKEV